MPPVRRSCADQANMSKPFRFPIVSHTLTCAAGRGLTELRDAMAGSQSGLRPNDFEHCDLETWIGRVAGVDDWRWNEGDLPWRSRNNALAALALDQDDFSLQVQEARERFGAQRIGVIVGTSTSSIGRTEKGYRQLHEDGRMPPDFRQPSVHNPHSPADFVAHKAAVSGPCMTISTACSSSAKVFASAARWLHAGLVDAVLVGGADSLCLSVLYGFNSLELISSDPCRPFDERRNGINLGEAAGFALMLREQDSNSDAPGAVALSGWGESSDAHHMSHPHPEGLGARMAMQQALERARLDPAEVGYINLHGTASQANDLIETQALAEVFPKGNTLASSTKGLSGHTLGAAGICEAVLAIEALTGDMAPGTLNLEQPDPGLAYPILAANQALATAHVMSNSFGFGGNNCSLVFSRR